MRGCLQLAVLLLAGWISTNRIAHCQSPTSGYELTFPAMGTLMAFQAFSDDQPKIETAFGEARREVERLVDILSDYSAESETALLSNKEKVGQWQPVSPELWEVLVVCDRWHKLSNGAFDASVGQLSTLWRKARKAKRVPTQFEIDTALRLCGWNHLRLDMDRRAVLFEIEGLKLDFGAMGKGYIIDRAYESLRKSGVPCALVRAGGDLRCGEAPPGKPGWGVEIARLNPREEVAHRIYLADAAVSSSGDLFQYMEIDGKRRSHVLDPRTGWGVIGPRMVTVIANRSTEADAADTALCAMSDGEAMELAKKLGNIDVRWVTLQSADTPPLVQMTAGFESRLR